MSTRGLIVFKYRNKIYAFYHHGDAYWSFLGVKILQFIMQTSISKMCELVEAMVLKDYREIDVDPRDCSILKLLENGVYNDDTGSFAFYEFHHNGRVCNLCEYMYTLDLDNALLHFQYGNRLYYQYCVPFSFITSEFIDYARNEAISQIFTINILCHSSSSQRKHMYTCIDERSDYAHILYCEDNAKLLNSYASRITRFFQHLSSRR